MRAIRYNHKTLGAVLHVHDEMSQSAMRAIRYNLQLGDDYLETLRYESQSAMRAIRYNPFLLKLIEIMVSN